MTPTSAPARYIMIGGFLGAGKTTTISRLAKHYMQQGKNVGSLTLRTLKLLDLYGDTILQAAVAQALARDTCELGALSLLCETQRRALSRPVPLDLPLGAHVPEHDVIPHPLESYDVK